MQEPWLTLRRLCTASAIALTCSGQALKKSTVLDTPIDQSTAVSFFWFGDINSHFRDPMNFYVARADDPRLHTVSIAHRDDSKGVETWITASEMQALLQKLAHSHFGWLESKTVEPFKPMWKRTDGHDMFDITVVSRNGTLRSSIRIARMCDELLAFDAVMPTPRLRWQFQTLRWDDGCVIDGYSNEAMPAE